MALIIHYDAKVLRKTTQHFICDIKTGTSAGFQAMKTFMQCFHPDQYPEISRGVQRCLNQFAEMDYSGHPGVPDIAAIYFLTPYGEQCACVVSILLYTGAKQRGIPMTQFTTVVCMREELESVLDSVCQIEKTLTPEVVNGTAVVQRR